MKNSRRGWSTGSPVGFRVALAMMMAAAAGCGDSLTGPGAGARARGDPVGIEGITVPAPCRMGECNSDAGSNPKEKKKNGQPAAGGGSAPGETNPSKPKKDEENCLALTVALSTALAAESIARNAYTREKRDYDAAVLTVTRFTKQYEPGGFTMREMTHVSELHRLRNKEEREMIEAHERLGFAKLALEGAKALWALGCGKGVLRG